MSEPSTVVEAMCVKAFEDCDVDTAKRLLPSIQKHDDITCNDLYARYTYLVHRATRNGWIDIAKELITQYNCNPLKKNSAGWTVLHVAAFECHLDILKYVINVTSCSHSTSMSDKDQFNGYTPLHWALHRSDNIEIVMYLVECGSDVMATADNGETPFQVACRYNYDNKNISAIKYLLSLPEIINSFDKDRLYQAEEPTIIEDMYNKFERIHISHPVGSYVNIFLIGNPGAGKTTLCHAIKKRFSLHIKSGELIKNVKTHTAGIVPNKICDRDLGNVIIHDFAGQPEYHSSHTAILESLLQNSGAVFVVVIDLTQDLSQQIKFWSSIVINKHQKVSSECHLIVVASHADKVENELDHKLFQLKGHLKELTVAGYGVASIFPLDCRQYSSGNLHSFVQTLAHFCTSIRNKQSPAISLYCNFLYSILEAKVSEDNFCTLEKLTSLCDQSRQEDVPLPDDIVPLLKTLHSSGLVVYLENKHDLMKSYIIARKEILLAEVDGVLFAPSYFVEHREIASNTGIITSSALQQLFPHYPSNMLIAFLQSMKLCDELMLDETLLKVTNLALRHEDSLHASDQLLFFPALIAEMRPQDIKGQFRVGWCLKFTGGYSFSIRFLHILLLHHAHQYSVAVTCGQHKPWVPDIFERQCSVWINGIHWYNDDDIETVVEQVEDNQCVLVLMSCREGAEVDMMQLHCEIIKAITDLQKEYCPKLECKEYLLAPCELQYPIDKPMELTFYDMEQLKLRISQGKDTILCVDARGKRATEIVNLLPIAPTRYLEMLRIEDVDCATTSRVSNILKPCIPTPIVMDSAVSSMMQRYGLTIEQVNSKITVSHLIARHIVNWNHLAPYLGLTAAEISAISRDGHDELERRKMMLDKWIRKNGCNASYQCLLELCLEADDRELADKILQELNNLSKFQTTTAKPEKEKNTILKPPVPSKPKHLTSSFNTDKNMKCPPLRPHKPAP